MSTFRRSRTDASHKECIQAARKWFRCVVDTHDVGGFVDFICGKDVVWLVEVKNPEKPPSKRSLTPDERAFAEKCPDKDRHVIVGCPACVCCLVLNERYGHEPTRCGRCAIDGPRPALEYDKATRSPR